MINILFGLFIGATIVGSSIERTLGVADGRVSMVIYAGVFNSFAHYFSMSFIAKDNISAYVGTCVGSIAVTIFMAHRNKRIKDDYKRL